MALCESILNQESKPASILEAVSSYKNEMQKLDTHINYWFSQEQKLESNRVARAKDWDRFVDDTNHKRACIESTFEQKEEELREFYSDLERKLNIHK